MAELNPLYTICVTVLGFICVIVGATAVGVPMWGYFESPSAGPSEERGYFGPWKTCKLLLYNRERCENTASRFRSSVAVWISGLVASIGVAVLSVFCFFSVIQLAMISSKKKLVVEYTATIVTKLALGLLSTLLAITSASLFCLQTSANGFQITRGPAFYIQVLLIVLNALLLLMTIYEVVFARKYSVDPTKAVTSREPMTYGNPGFRGAISMTDASGQPHLHVSNGSMSSMVTTSTTLGSTNGSSVSRSPLRSSLKKPRQTDALGIQNPGFSGTSPVLSRNGSTKKVRIQTQSTEV